MVCASVLESQSVNVSLRDTTLEHAIWAVARQANVRVSFDKENAVFSRKISADIKADNINAAFVEILKGTNLEPTMTSDGETVIIRVKTDSSKNSNQSTGSISGTVVDSASGRGIRGVVVRIVASSLSTVTDERGTFHFANVAPGEHLLSFRLIGYKSTTRNVNIDGRRSAPIRVILSETANMLSEVVTSVTGTQRKLEVGNDITVIDVDSVMRTAPVSSVTDILEARVPGLTVMRSSGVPGAPSRIRIRGIGGGLLSSQPGAPTNDPIVVVDGIRINASQSGVDDQNLAAGNDFPTPSPIDQIDPNSIEKIEVLKGPSASALYGSDAANGVIVITTKKGVPGKTRWSVTGNSSMTYFPGTYVPPNYYGFCYSPWILTAAGRLSSCDGSAAQFLDRVEHFQALNEPRLTTFGSGTANDISGTVSGGTQSITYSLTASLGSELGLLRAPPIYKDLYRDLYDSAMPRWMQRPNLLQKKAVNASMTLEPRKALRVTLSSRLSSQQQRQSTAQLKLSYWAEAYVDTNSLSPSMIGEYATKVTSDRLVFDQAAVASWDAWYIFPVMATVGFSRDEKTDTRLLPRGFPTVANVRDSMGRFNAGTQSTNTFSTRINGTLFPGRRFSMAMGTDLTDQSRQQIKYRADSLTRGVVNPTRIDQAQPSSYAKSTGGWFMEPRLNLNSRFFVNPGFRFDGNSVSGRSSGVRNSLWSLFPRLNFSWIAVDAQGDAPYGGFLTLLRPRLGFGVAGVQPAPGWQLRLLTETKQDGFEDGGLEISTIGNSKLRPERTREIEGGFDVELWDSRLNITATQFLKFRYDAIEQIPTPLSIYGGLNQYHNIGQVRNVGTEISIDATVLENQLVRWSISASLSRYSNTLVALNSDLLKNFNLRESGTRLVVGYPIFSRWSYPILGWAAPSTATGQLLRRDVILGDTAIYMGQQAPNFELPFRTSLSLWNGQVSINAGFQYKDGLTQVGTVAQLRSMTSEFNPDFSQAARAAALVACPQGGIEGLDGCSNYGLTQTVNSLRFNSLSVGYNIPRSISSRLRIPSVAVAVQGSNLGLWTNYRGKDPDVNAISLGDQTTDGGQLSTPRLWRLKINIRN